MGNIIDLTGQVFGRLTVIEYYETRKGRARWHCQCSCGNIKVIDGKSLRNGATKSCGCFRVDEMKKRRKSRITVTCAYCGAKKQLIPALASRDGLFFCNYEHKYKYQMDQVEVECASCGAKKLLKRSKAERSSRHFCNIVCRDAFVNGDKSRCWKGGKTETVKCAFCGKERQSYKCQTGDAVNNFCNTQCQGKWRSIHKCGEDSYVWQGGLSFEPYPITWSFSLRESIRDRDGRICQVCGKSGNGKRLAVHHIDYDKENCKPENLITLCTSCHTKTNSNREQWTSFFQDLLRQQGKITDDYKTFGIQLAAIIQASAPKGIAQCQ